MRMTKAFIPTLKEDPSEAEVISHKLMIRSGLIRKLGSGAYIYLPLGYRVLKKVEDVIRQEMDKAGALELLMPAIHPRELWERTGRYSLLKDILITYKDRQGKDYLLGPTHEEVITDLVAREIRSYRDLPKTLYQIQTKFRDEPRPRFGVLRSKEFIMKDAYSFDIDQDGLNASYKLMYNAYCRIFKRCGLRYIPVDADSGFMGGDVSHEFMVPAASGEDIIALCEGCGYAGSRDVCECVEDPAVQNQQALVMKDIKELSIPNVTTIDKVSQFLKIKPNRLVKTLIFLKDKEPVAVLLRGDHDLNEVKFNKYLGATSLEMADEETIRRLTGGPVGFSGPIGLKDVRIIADNTVKGMRNFVTGSNKIDLHLVNVNHGRDFEVKEWADLRHITDGDLCPKCCNAKIRLEKTIEVGHTFKLGMKYSKALKAGFLDSDGTEKTCIMGCYGIGVNRIIASCIEQNYDKDGIIWPPEIAPYRVTILCLNMSHKESNDTAEWLYRELSSSGIDVLFDDRQESAGVKFKDADLIGIPFQVVVGERALAKSQVEIKQRRDKSVELVSKGEALKKIKELL